jgi:hypothetical protein
LIVDAVFINSASSICAQQSVDILTLFPTDNSLLKYLGSESTSTAATAFFSAVASFSSVPFTSSPSLTTATSAFDNSSSLLATSSIATVHSGGLRGKAEGAVVAGSALAGILAIAVLVFFCLRCNHKRKDPEDYTSTDLPEWRGLSEKSAAIGVNGSIDAVEIRPADVPELEGSPITHVNALNT